MIQDTSIKSYADVKEFLGDRQNIVLNAISDLGECTDSEIANYLGYPDLNSVRPRRFELVELGLVQEKCRRICKITGKTAISWCLGGKTEAKPVKSCLCSHKFNKMLMNLSKCNEYQKAKIKEVLN
jgi:transcription initiation factor IIE alpha subunit